MSKGATYKINKLFIDNYDAFKIKKGVLIISCLAFLVSLISLIYISLISSETKWALVLTATLSVVFLIVSVVMACLIKIKHMRFSENIKTMPEDVQNFYEVFRQYSLDARVWFIAKTEKVEIGIGIVVVLLAFAGRTRSRNEMFPSLSNILVGILIVLGLSSLLIIGMLYYFFKRKTMSNFLKEYAYKYEEALNAKNMLSR